MKFNRNIPTVFLMALLLTQACYSKTLTLENAPTQVCFSPRGYCENSIVRLINSAKHSLTLQAYSFTSKRIASALVAAKQRGVHVAVLVDKSQTYARYSKIADLIKANIPVRIDFRPKIAHNKIIVVDESIVETGSYNFSKAANRSNAENVLIIQSKPLAKVYHNQFLSRFKYAMPVQRYCTIKGPFLVRDVPTGYAHHCASSVIAAWSDPKRKATLPPRYLAIAGWKSCLKTKSYGTWQGWCLPKQKPTACNKRAWIALQANVSVGC